MEKPVGSVTRPLPGSGAHTLACRPLHRTTLSLLNRVTTFPPSPGRQVEPGSGLGPPSHLCAWGSCPDQHPHATKEGLGVPHHLKSKAPWSDRGTPVL